MAQNRLAIASVLLVALLGVTVWTMNRREAEVDKKPETTVELPKIEKDSVTELDISAAKKPDVKLVKTDAGWRVAKPVDAEADQSAVDAALDKLAELEVTGVAATNDKNHELLEVVGDKSLHVIAKAGDKVLLDAHIGRYRAGSTMLRKEGEVPVAAVKGSIRYAFAKEVREWRNREITKVEAGDVVGLTLENDKGTLHFVKEGDAWAQAPGDKPIQNFDPSKVSSLVGSAASLRAVDFAEPDATPEQTGLGEDAASTATLTLGGDAGVEAIVYHIGKKKMGNYFLTREGNDTIFQVSSWIGERLTSGADEFQKKADAPAPTAKAPNVIEATPIPRPNDLRPVGKIHTVDGPKNPH